MSIPFLSPQECAKPYSVLEINTGISDIIESGNCLVWVEAEISNCKPASSGHIYLTLKDESSQISAVIWRSTAQKISILPQNGMLVAVIAIIRVYKKGGTYQLDIQKIKPAGEGARALALQKLKQKLLDEGLFSPNRKKPLPDTIARLGVITSITGAAVHDIIRVVNKRSPQTDIVIADSAVQGDLAVPQLVSALAHMNQRNDIDCIIIGRGGGSTEDLWAFNDERVVRAIAASSIPVIAAIGHETDFTLADLVADQRAPTPSAAAEMAIADSAESQRYFLSVASRVLVSCMSFFSTQKEHFKRISSSKGLKKPLILINDHRQTLDGIRYRINRMAKYTIEKRRSALLLAAGQLNALSPLQTLSRGYSIVTNKSGLSVKNSSQIKPGESIGIRFSKGSAHCTVNALEE